MPPIALPQLRPVLKNAVRYPNAPAALPTNADMAAGVILAEEVYRSRRQFRHSLADGEC